MTYLKNYLEIYFYLIWKKTSARILFFSLLILNGSFFNAFANTQTHIEDPCLSQEKLSYQCKPTGCSQIDRVGIMCKLKRIFLNYYASLGLKQERIGLSPIQHLNQCVLEEKHLLNSSFISFYERIRKCMSGFQDSHLWIGFSSSKKIPHLEAGIRVQEVQGKFYIIRVRPDLAWEAGNETQAWKLEKMLSLGTEVLEINGEPIAKVRDRLLPYVFGSSLAARKADATYFLFTRNFLFPKNPTFRLKIKYHGKTIFIDRTWYFQPGEQTLWNQALSAKGFLSLTQHGKRPLVFQKTSSGNWEVQDIDSDWKGRLPGTPIGVTMEQKSSWGHFLKRTFYSTSERFPSFRFVLNGEKKFCYAQLLSFDFDSFVSSKTGTTDAFRAWKRFLSACNQNHFPLILDLRQNPGGYASYPAKLFQLLTPYGKKFSSFLFHYRVTPQIIKILSRTAGKNPRLWPVVSNFRLMQENLYTELSKKWKKIQNLPISKRYAFYSKPYIDDTLKGKGIFLGKIIALISSQCVSACDMFAALLKEHQRALLIGMPTQGTGSGFSGETEDRTFTLGYNDFKIGIPNFLFGIRGVRRFFSEKKIKTLFQRTSFTPMPFLEKIFYVPAAYYLLSQAIPKYTQVPFVTENEPILPDKIYKTSLNDLRYQNEGWFQAIKKYLFQP